MLSDAIKRAKAPAILWDGTIPGFGLRGGKQFRTFFVLLDSLGNRKTMGRYGTDRASAENNRPDYPMPHRRDRLDAELWHGYS